MMNVIAIPVTHLTVNLLSGSLIHNNKKNKSERLSALIILYEKRWTEKVERDTTMSENERKSQGVPKEGNEAPFLNIELKDEQ